MKTKIFIILFAAILSFSLVSCGDDEPSHPVPAFSNLTITPEKSVYKVGDQVTLSITQTGAQPTEIKKATYWFYYNYVEFYYKNEAMFVTAKDNGDGTYTYTSPTITLTKAGQADLSFWGQYNYGGYGNYDGVEFHKVVTVEE